MTRRTGNRARENRVLHKNVCFATGRQKLLSLEKVQNLDVQIWVFFGQIVFSLQ